MWKRGKWSTWVKNAFEHRNWFPRSCGCSLPCLPMCVWEEWQIVAYSATLQYLKLRAVTVSECFSQWWPLFTLWTYKDSNCDLDIPSPVTLCIITSPHHCGLCTERRPLRVFRKTVMVILMYPDSTLCLAKFSQVCRGPVYLEASLRQS